MSSTNLIFLFVTKGSRFNERNKELVMKDSVMAEPCQDNFSPESVTAILKIDGSKRKAKWIFFRFRSQDIV